LQIAPVIPQAWSGFETERVFRGVTYKIKVERAGPGHTINLTVDGQPVGGDVIPLPPAGQAEVLVKAVLL
jgi:cellobiose phosphorylase